MKLGLIGDVHAEHEYLARAVEYLKKEGAGALYCTGDITDGRGDVNACCEILAAENIQTVRGNHDRWTFEGREGLTALSSLTPETKEFLRGLPVTLRIETELGAALLCHGFGENDMAKILPGMECTPDTKDELRKLIEDPSVAIVINGHSHRRMACKVGGLTVVNAGTLLHRDTPCFSMLDCAAGTVQFYDFTGDGGEDIGSSLRFDLSALPEEAVDL